MSIRTGKVYRQSVAPLETCCECDTPTGKAGENEDSLYCADCGDGPFCAKCFDIHMDNHNQGDKP